MELNDVVKWCKSNKHGKPNHMGKVWDNYGRIVGTLAIGWWLSWPPLNGLMGWLKFNGMGQNWSPMLPEFLSICLLQTIGLQNVHLYPNVYTENHEQLTCFSLHALNPAACFTEESLGFGDNAVKTCCDLEIPLQLLWCMSRSIGVSLFGTFLRFSSTACLRIYALFSVTHPKKELQRRWA